MLLPAANGIMFALLSLQQASSSVTRATCCITIVCQCHTACINCAVLPNFRWVPSLATSQWNTLAVVTSLAVCHPQSSKPHQHIAENTLAHQLDASAAGTICFLHLPGAATATHLYPTATHARLCSVLTQLQVSKRGLASSLPCGAHASTSSSPRALSYPPSALHCWLLALWATGGLEKTLISASRCHPCCSRMAGWWRRRWGY